MRARTPSLLKAVWVVAIISIAVSLISGFVQYSLLGRYFRMEHLLYTLSFTAFFAVILCFCASRQKENDFTAYQLRQGEWWKPTMTLRAMYLGVFGVHRSRLGYPTSARVIRWGFISFIIGSIILVLMLATGSWGAIRFGIVLFYLTIAYFSISALWSFVDTFRIMSGRLKPADGSYAPSELEQSPQQRTEV